jgi:hypothetical protein
MQFLMALGIWLVGSLAARVLLGAGLAIGFHTWVSGAVEDYLGELVAGIGALGAAGQIVLIAGAGPALSVIGGALVARAAIVAAGAWVGRAS